MRGKIVSDGEGFDYYLLTSLIIAGLVIYVVIEHYFPYPLSIVILMGGLCILGGGLCIISLALLRWKPKKTKPVTPELKQLLKEKGFKFEDEQDEA